MNRIVDYFFDSEEQYKAYKPYIKFGIKLIAACLFIALLF